MTDPDRLPIPGDGSAHAEPALAPDAPPPPADAAFDPVASSLNVGLDTSMSPRNLAIGGAIVAAALLLLLGSRRRTR